MDAERVFGVSSSGVPTGAVLRYMEPVSRRLFLVRSSLAAAAAGAAASIPGLVNVLGDADGAAPTVDAGTADTQTAVSDMASVDSQPLIAHVRDVQTGEIGIFSGGSEVVIRDPQLANRLLGASR
jgi:hypothetical protein